MSPKGLTCISFHVDLLVEKPNVQLMLEVRSSMEDGEDHNYKHISIVNLAEMRKISMCVAQSPFQFSDLK